MSSRPGTANRETETPPPDREPAEGGPASNDFSPRRGCFSAPLLVFVLLALIAGFLLVAKYRYPFPGTPPAPTAHSPMG
jgi:hypothetical protein